MITQKTDILYIAVTIVWNSFVNASTDFEKKMLLWTKEEFRSYEDAKVFYICGKRILRKLFKSENYWKVKDHYHNTGKHRGAPNSLCNLKFNVPNEILAVCHNNSIYNYHFTIKELANEFEEQLECFGENRKAQNFFHSNRERVTNINKNGNKSVVTLSYQINFIDSARFMATSLSNLVNDPTEGFHKIKQKDCVIITLSLSSHEQVCLSGLRFERYLCYYQAYYEYWTDNQKDFYV